MYISVAESVIVIKEKNENPKLTKMTVDSLHSSNDIKDVGHVWFISKKMDDKECIS